jgi:hypothetical protein
MEGMSAMKRAPAILTGLLFALPAPVLAAGDSGAATPAPAAQAPPAAAPGGERGQAFIVATIANLRGLDPAFPQGRQLTLTDGRRAGPQGGSPGPAAAPAHVIRALNLPAGWQGEPVAERRPCVADLCSGQADLLRLRADGSARVIFRGLTGPFIALAGSRSVFGCAQADAGHAGAARAAAAPPAAGQPSVVDLDGVRTPLGEASGTLRLCERAGSGDQVLLIHAMDGAQGDDATARPRITARVFDAYGGLLAEGSFDAAGLLHFRAAGRRYTADIPAP